MADKEDDKHPPEQKKATRIQVIGLVAILIILMSASVITAMLASGVVEVAPQGAGPVRSMTDAMLICDSAISEKHSDTLQTFALDDLSSRSAGDGFQLYYKLIMFRDSSRRTGTNTLYASCFVTGSGWISQLDLIANRDTSPRAAKRQPGGAFGAK